MISDVSGKGVPAALFMVIAKTLIKNQTQPGIPLGEVFTRVNNQLCENNGEAMFVTSFMGVLDLDTLAFTFVNAGHNPPLLMRSGQSYEFLQVKPGFVLAGLEGMRYKEETISSPTAIACSSTQTASQKPSTLQASFTARIA